MTTNDHDTTNDDLAARSANEDTSEPVGCPEWCDDLTAFLYDDLDADREAEVRAHVSTCERCQAELQSAQSTTRLLDTWSIEEHTWRQDNDDVGLSIGHPKSQAGAWNRFRPWWAGGIAAAVFFALFVMIGAQVEVQNGAFRLTIGTPTAVENIKQPTGAFAGDAEIVLTRFRNVAGEEADSRIETLLNTLEEYLAEFRRKEESRRLSLAQAVDRRIHEERLEHRLQLQALAQQLLFESSQARGAINEIRTHMVAEEGATVQDDPASLLDREGKAKVTEDTTTNMQ